MKFSLTLFVVAPLVAAPITTATVNLSNLQSTATISTVSGYSTFTDFAFTQAFISDDPLGIQISLPLGSGGYLRSNPTSQSIYAQTSVDFSVPGYKLLRIDLIGSAIDDGASAGEAFGMSAPCTLSISGSASYGNRTCTIPGGGASSGTITAWLRMYSDSRIYHSDSGRIGNPAISMTMIHNPEPASFVLIGLGLIGIWAVGQRRA